MPQSQYLSCTSYQFLVEVTFKKVRGRTIEAIVNQMTCLTGWKNHTKGNLKANHLRKNYDIHSSSIKVSCFVFKSYLLGNHIELCFRELLWANSTVSTHCFTSSQPAIICSKLTIETLEQDVKYVQR